MTIYIKIIPSLMSLKDLFVAPQKYTGRACLSYCFCRCLAFFSAKTDFDSALCRCCCSSSILHLGRPRHVHTILLYGESTPPSKPSQIQRILTKEKLISTLSCSGKLRSIMPSLYIGCTPSLQLQYLSRDKHSFSWTLFWSPCFHGRDLHVEIGQALQARAKAKAENSLEGNAIF